MPPKSGFSRTRNIDYDDDDIYDDDDDYYEEEAGEADAGDGMTEDDKEQMRAGTIRVREALGDKSDFTSDEQIQEALWHYYYDIGKSVIYLKNKLGVSEPKPEVPKQEKAKTVSRFDQAASVAEEKAPVTTDASAAPLCCPPYTVAPISMPTNAAVTDFFWDVPWGNVPPERLGVITVDPPHYKGGLLGGSSKLAALAAKRRKDREDAEAAASKANHDADSAIAMLDKLSVKNQEGGNASVGGGTGPARPSRYPIRRRSPSPAPETPKEPEIEEPQAPQPAVVVESPAQRATASMFASTLCGSDESSKHPQAPLQEVPLPFAAYKSYDGSGAFAGPSPDDIVRAAQAKGAGGGRTTPKKKKKQTNGDLTESVEKLTVADEPRVKSKNLNVVDEFEKSASKRLANFVVLGHVDHGKSTLMGRLLYDLKVIDQRSIDKLRKEAETIGKSSFALAWVMDETSEERSRGVTVDIATNYFETDKTKFTILDAPGHKDFIPNMISGASQADFPVLVIDASTNSFESGLKGQTKEHILIARSMGMQHIIVAVNKMDTVGWSKSRFDDISKRMTAFLTEASFLEKRITFIPLAGLTGENVVKKIENSAAHWYTGETLLEALERIDLPLRNFTKPLRLSVADVFRGDIRSPLSISGRIDAGTLQVGDVILALPANETATIKSIEVQDAPVDWAVCGQIPTLHLTDIDPVHLRQGDIVCARSDPVKLVKAFTSKLLAFEHVLPMPVEVFRSTLNSPAGIRTLSAKLNKFTGEVVKKKPRIVKPGEVARVVVQLERELPVEEGMRVVLRERGRTVGAGLMENVA
ncbi:elongation factor 1-alpha [Alternaria rosae]|uniref:elongation factor 1-alpha n=1 Tax=Alternaria rosae TaxID=1187941 RepID=UPI001E8E9CA2|nr:elongation factor 1-alpha [Alternaria rosae]KAH6865420.1 elongation factor 1-alpha [Alternaria rosae]